MCIDRCKYKDKCVAHKLSKWSISAISVADVIKHDKKHSIIKSFS